MTEGHGHWPGKGPGQGARTQEIFRKETTDSPAPLTRAEVTGQKAAAFYVEKRSEFNWT